MTDAQKLRRDWRRIRRALAFAEIIATKDTREYQMAIKDFQQLRCIRREVNFMFDRLLTYLEGDANSSKEKKDD